MPRPPGAFKTLTLIGQFPPFSARVEALVVLELQIEDSIGLLLTSLSLSHTGAEKEDGREDQSNGQNDVPGEISHHVLLSSRKRIQ